MIRIESLTLQRGPLRLLENANLTLHPGQKVGLLGTNGAGKSSLFALMRGELTTDAGSCSLPEDWRIAHMQQEIENLERRAVDYVLDGDNRLRQIESRLSDAQEREDAHALGTLYAELEAHDGFSADSRARTLLAGLGFSSEQCEALVGDFSGGWRMRLNLAQALMCPSDLLLLDEPTNHLDLDAVYWLEQWLLKYPGTLLLISHDREFLDNVATHTLHLHGGGAKLYPGGYTDFERQRAEQLRQQQIAHEKEQAERAHLQSFIDRFKAQASKAAQAQSRMKRLAKLAGTEAVRAEREFRIEFAPPAKLPFSLIRLNHVEAGYGKDAVILHNVGFGLEAGQRIGLLGPNGAGKTTLVKTLVGELAPIVGERMAHPDLKIGYFAQHTVESLHEGQSPMEHFREIAPDAPNQSFRDFLGKWNFPGDRAFEPVDGFSGGERARLALALIAWQQPNVLLLDEPTNHLDLEMREALAEALATFEGAIVMVSHDRHLIGLVCDTYWRVADGVVEPFDGDLDAYAAWLRTRPQAQGTKARMEQVEEPVVVKTAPVAQVVQKKPVNPHKLAAAEAKVAELEGALAELDRQLADPANYADATRMAVIGRDRETTAAQLEKAEAAWMELLES